VPDNAQIEIIHTVGKAVARARVILNDPSITEAAFRHWVVEGKVRFRKFGGTYAFILDELTEDLAGKVAREEEEVA
jgi:hypothetical protein